MKTLRDSIRQYETISGRQKWSLTKRYLLARIEDHLGHEPLEKLDRAALVRFAMSYDGSIKTADRMLATLSGCLMACDDLDLMHIPHPTAAKDASRALRRRSIVSYRARQTPRITNTVLEQIIDRWNSGVPPAYLWILIDTAMRSGELCRLDWSQVDLVSRTVTLLDRKDPSAPDGNDQVLPLLGRAPATLAAITPKTGRVCPYPRNTMALAFRKAAKRAGYRHTLHDLRHEGISRMFERGWSIPEVAAVSGHRNWSVLKGYTNISPEHLLELDAADRDEPRLPSRKYAT